MTSLPPLLWRHCPCYYDGTSPATMTSLTLYYDVTSPATMMLLAPRLWCHLALYYDITNPSTMTSLLPLLWRRNTSWQTRHTSSLGSSSLVSEPSNAAIFCLLSSLVDNFRHARGIVRREAVAGVIFGRGMAGLGAGLVSCASRRVSLAWAETAASARSVS